MSQQAPHVHETDVYVEHESPAPPPTAPRRSVVFRPLIVGIMVSCLIFGLIQCLHQFAPGRDWAYLLLIPIPAAYMGHTAYHLARQRYGSEADRRRFQMIELAVLFLLLKAATYLDRTLPEIWQDIRHWPENPFLFFDFQTLLTFGIACVAWFSAVATARDLEAVADPTIYIGESGPMERLNRRFLLGGLALLFLSGLAYINRVTEQGDGRATTAGGLVSNVLFYFVLGLIVLGQVRLIRLNRLWELQKYAVSTSLHKTWLKYSLLFLLGALLIALVLPTQYTLGLIDIARFIISVIAQGVILIYLFIHMLFNFLLSFLFRTTTDTEALPTPPPPTTPAPIPQTTPSGVSIPWLPLLRSIVFWVVMLGAIGYILYSYLKDRPEFVHAFSASKVMRLVQRWWHALRTWWRGTQRAFLSKLPTLSLNFLRRQEAPRASAHVGRRKGASWREHILHAYLETLERAGEEGFPRRATQTPYEYHRTLEPHLPEAQAEMTALTAAFVEARYSPHPIKAEDVAVIQSNARRVRAALDKLHADKDHE